MKDADTVTTMKGDMYSMITLDQTSFRSYCVMYDDENYLDASEMLTEMNFGAQINDCFDAELYNVTGEAHKVEGSDDWVPIISIIALRDLLKGEELYLEYGKKYWCYRSNFMSLPVAQQTKCREHYAIVESDFIETPKVRKVTKAKAPAKKSAAKKATAAVAGKRKTKA